ncbi:type 2 isopentenyl-diphosphate Delta-isomerase [Brevibacillus panacihumi]|uniref:Isopentenyl-diphosphate delta-isomerase n=1 Tax=Brevibacillus panacihumi TaxID=497735 RepID=A0A3M8DAF9_9BACL|nr:type 2 isopentenyl-diphosphate Delta-isomerase [Brevibacillus panacihumi]RNB84923.1 type 2 isopentenyl-diphosphate Delta-isomerase [Brevibacillus panacihumi]
MDRSQRKMDHIQHALATNELQTNGFDEIRFVPNSLPNIYYGNTSLDSTMGSFRLSSPILINAMTGGAASTTTINRNLAIIARERGLAMAVGSQMAALRDPSVRDSYRVVRKENPNGILFANIGAEASVEQALAAVEMLEADGLQIHLNVMQELLMPEGDRDFTGYLERMERISEQVPVPVLVKEVGFGMTKESIGKLMDIRIPMIDVGGRGGTNFAKVENMRRSKPLPMFDDWGLTTVESLLEAREWMNRGTAFVATGGIRHGLDVAKALALGADAVGIAGGFLRIVQTQSIEGALHAVDEWHHQVRVAMTALGITQVKDFSSVPLIFSERICTYAQQRKIDLAGWANRD